MELIHEPIIINEDLTDIKKIGDQTLSSSYIYLGVIIFIFIFIIIVFYRFKNITDVAIKPGFKY